MTPSNDNLADDVLKGAESIARFIGISRRAVYHAATTNALPIFRLGETIMARKSTLLAWIGQQEATARAA